MFFYSQNETCILVEAESRFSLPVINCSYRIDVNTYTVLISHFTDLAYCFVFCRFIQWDLMVVVSLYLRMDHIT